MNKLIVAALIVAASTATAQEMPCLSPEQTPRVMSNMGFELEINARGGNLRGAGVVQFWVHQNGNWYMFLIYSDGTACPVLWGTEWWDGELM